jgi:nucleoside-diphosphate-sugar epimerase
MKLLITGAGGFLGRRVVAAALRGGHSVRALVRQNSCFDSVDSSAAVETFRGDLCTTEDLAPAFAGVDVMVHLAAAVTGDEPRMFAATVQGTERLLAAMARSNCRRIVLASTFAVYDWRGTKSLLDEDSPLETDAGLHFRDAYARTKYHQEGMTRRLVAEHGWELTVLRPGYIWGRGLPDIAACSVTVGHLHLIIGPATRLPLTHVENCADLFAKAATDPRAPGKTFNVVDGPGERIWTYVGDHLRLSGEGGIRLPVSYTLASAAIKVLYAASLKRRDRLPSLFIPRRFEARLKPLLYSNRRVEEQLGWQPPLAYSDCMQLTYPNTATDRATTSDRLPLGGGSDQP